MALRETTILVKELLSDAAITVANVIGKMGSDDDHMAVCSAATDGMLGIIQQTATAAEQTLRIVLEGIADIKLGGTVTRGQLITSNASALGIAASAGQNYVGIALVSGVANDIGSVLVCPGLVPSGAVDGLGSVHCARATWDFAVDGGAVSAIDLDVDIPDNAVVHDALIDVVTGMTSAGGGGTIAIHLQTANDILSAVDADTISGVVACVPVGTAATAIKLTAARAVTATIAVEALTAGKIVIFIYYMISA